MLDPTSFDALNGICLENGITYQAYSVLERGLLTGAYDMNSVIKPGDARNEWCVWYQPKRRKRIVDLLESWKPLCEKYHTSQAGLTIAWTLQQAPNINVDVGSRRPTAVEQNCRGGEFLISSHDLEQMSSAVKVILKEEGVVGGNPTGK